MNFVLLILLMMFSGIFGVKDGVKRKCRASTSKTLETFREEVMNAFIHLEHSELIPVKLVFDNQKFPTTCYVLNNVRYVTFNSISEEGTQSELFSIEYQIHRRIIDHYYKWIHQYTYKTNNVFLFPTSVDKALKIFERIKNTHLLQKESSVSLSSKMWYQARIKNEIAQQLDPLKNNTVYYVYLIHEDASDDDKPVGFFKLSDGKIRFSIISDKRPPLISPAKKAKLLQLSTEPEYIKPIPVPKGNPFGDNITLDRSNDSIQPSIEAKLALLKNRIKGAQVIKQENGAQKEDLFAKAPNNDSKVKIPENRNCMFAALRSVTFVIASMLLVGFI